jgi:hypothetical protein
MVRLLPEEQQQFLRDHPKMFDPAAGAWGRQGATMVELKAADKRTIRAALTLAWQHIMELPPPKKRASKSAAKATPRKTGSGGTGRRRKAR